MYYTLVGFCWRRKWITVIVSLDTWYQVLRSQGPQCHKRSFFRQHKALPTRRRLLLVYTLTKNCGGIEHTCSFCKASNYTHNPRYTRKTQNQNLCPNNCGTQCIWYYTFKSLLLKYITWKRVNDMTY